MVFGEVAPTGRAMDVLDSAVMGPGALRWLCRPAGDDRKRDKRPSRWEAETHWQGKPRDSRLHETVRSQSPRPFSVASVQAALCRAIASVKAGNSMQAL